MPGLIATMHLPTSELIVAAVEAAIPQENDPNPVALAEQLKKTQQELEATRAELDKANKALEDLIQSHAAREMKQKHQDDLLELKHQATGDSVGDASSVQGKGHHNTKNGRLFGRSKRNGKNGNNGDVPMALEVIPSDIDYKELGLTIPEIKNRRR